jgi:hypothetical protein
MKSRIGSIRRHAAFVSELIESRTNKLKGLTIGQQGSGKHESMPVAGATEMRPILRFR